MTTEFDTARTNAVTFLTTEVAYTSPLTGPGLGLPNVYNRIRYTIEPNVVRSDLAEKVGAGAQDHRVHTWQVTRRAIAGERNGNFRDRVHEMVIRGYLAFSDALDTEGEFQAIIEAVLDVLEKHVQWGSTGDCTDPVALSHARQPEAEVIDFVEYVGVLCHHCEIIVDVRGVKVLAAVA